MADALGTPPPATGQPGVVSDEDHRLDQAGLIAPQSSSIAVRTGVMHGPGATTILTGTSATAPMTVNVGVHHWVTTRGTADGVYLGTKEASGTVSFAAAPGSNSRIDVVYVKQADAGSSISPDATTAPEYGVVTGTAAVSPVKPALPVGAIELGTVTIATGATATNGAGVTIANTAQLTSSRGTPVPCRTQAERDALTTFAGLHVTRIDLGGVIQRWVSGTTWETYVTDVGVAATKGTLSLASGWDAYPGYYTPGYHLSSDGLVTLRGLVRRSGANVSLTTLTIATLPVAIRPTANISPNSYVALGSGAATYPARLFCTGGTTSLIVTGMEGSVGTFFQNVGYVALDGVSWYL